LQRVHKDTQNLCLKIGSFAIGNERSNLAQCPKVGRGPVKERDPRDRTRLRDLETLSTYRVRMLDTTATGASFAGGQNNDVARLTRPHLL
jgi:hypothetical protein